MPRYLHLLNKLKSNGLKDVSSTLIAKELKLDPTQVRKDIEHTEIVGKPKTGYLIEDLINSIKAFLNWNNIDNAFIIGAGNLGSAMLGYQHFRKYGLNFVAAFDTDKKKIGTRVYDIPVLDILELPELAKKLEIKFGVLTVPGKHAQVATEIMLEGGIKAIWNFVPCQLNVPDDIIVENAQLTQSLAVISRKLHASKPENSKKKK